MRSNMRQRQEVYFCKISEKIEGIDTVREYQKPECLWVTVSSTSGTPEEQAAGIVLDYDRYITHWKSRWDNFGPEEGMLLWIDEAPDIDDDGNLMLDDEGEPTVLPDYRLLRIIDTQKGTVARYGIVKTGGDFYGEKSN